MYLLLPEYGKAGDTVCHIIHKMHSYYAAKNMGCQTGRNARQYVPVRP